MLESMLKICIYTGINADVTLEDGQRTECEDRARILKQNSQLCFQRLEPPINSVRELAENKQGIKYGCALEGSTFNFFQVS